MEVILRSHKRRVKKKVIRDHYWYDPDTQQRLHGRGGQMIFVYDRINKKSVPRIVDHEEWVYEDSFDDIVEWIDNNNIQIVESVPRKHVVIDVEARLWNDLEQDLYRHKIISDYDEAQFRKETPERGEKKAWQNSQSKWPILLPH
jgi:hypothetical protein